MSIASIWFSIRAIGSAAMNLCMVAEGSCDAYFEYGIHIWDYGMNSILSKKKKTHCLVCHS